MTAKPTVSSAAELFFRTPVATDKIPSLKLFTHSGLLIRSQEQRIFLLVASSKERLAGSSQADQHSVVVVVDAKPTN